MANCCAIIAVGVLRRAIAAAAYMEAAEKQITLVTYEYSYVYHAKKYA